MACRVKDCDNIELSGFKYCEKHLCNRRNCKKRKFRNNPFCFSHQHINKKSIILAGVLPLILAIIFPIRTEFICPKLHYFCFGELTIDFKENDIVLNEKEVPSVKIEVINNLGYPLLYVNGTATLNCSNLKHEIQSKTFELEGGRDFLANGGKSELLFSPDPLFVDLIKSREYKCSDATFQLAEYYGINETHGKLKKVYSFEIFDEEPIRIVNKTHHYSKEIIINSCMYCDVIINIFASNIKEPITKKEEYHKFIGASIEIFPFREFARPVEGITIEHFLWTFYEYLHSLKLCNGLTPDECKVLVCNEIKKKYDIGIKCGEKSSKVLPADIPTDILIYGPNRSL